MIDLRDKLSDWEWRIDNLYKIIDSKGRKVTFRRNVVQRYVFDNLWYKTVILKARQFGVTTFFVIFFLDRILFRENCECGLIAHTLPEAGNIFRKKLLFAYDNLPNVIKESRPPVKRDGNELILDHGGGNQSSFRVATSMRSETLQYLHVSEYGKISARTPDKAKEIKTGSLNAGRHCMVTIESTAEGRIGEFYDICTRAINHVGTLTEMDYRFLFFPWYQHPEYRLKQKVKIPDQLEAYFEGLPVDEEQKAWYFKKSLEQNDDMKQEFPSTPEEAFEQAIDGAYYADQMNVAYADGRVGEVRYNSRYPVHTAWDIGHSDATSIWFFQAYADEYHFLEYYEAVGRTLGHFADYVKGKPWRYHRNVAPHDIRVKEWAGGRSRLETALVSHNLSFEVAPSLSVMDGIDAARTIMGKCRFDAVNCARGLSALQSYRREWDEKRGAWKDNPCHDWSSHGADSFRYFAVTKFDSSLTRIGANLIEECAE